MLALPPTALRICVKRSSIISELLPSFSTSAVSHARKNPRRYPKTVMDLPEHLAPLFKDKMEHEYPAGLEGFGVRPIGVKLASTGKFVVIPEMIPELVVPDLDGFNLKPYVSFKVPDIKEPELTARDLFDNLHGKDVKDAFEAGRLEEELAELERRQELGQLTMPSYDLEPPRQLETSKVPVV